MERYQNFEYGEMVQLYKDKDWLYQKYVIEGLSMTEIGKLCGYKKGNSGMICVYLKKYGIRTRTLSEAQTGEKSYWWGKSQSKETKEKRSKALKNKGYEELFGKEEAERLKAKRSEDKRKWYEQNSGIYSGENNPFYGHKHTKEAKQKQREASEQLWQNSEFAENQSEVRKRLWQNPEWRRMIVEIQRRITKKLWQDLEYRRAHVEAANRPETIRKKKEVGKELWQDPKYAERVIKAILKANAIKPNKAELKLNEVLQQILPNEYKYVGDGEFILAGKCPDFVNINGQKKIIELYGNYWHKGETGKERIALFKQYGYETLIVWGSELKDEEELRNKILGFADSK